MTTGIDHRNNNNNHNTNRLVSLSDRQTITSSQHVHVTQGYNQTQWFHSIFRINYIPYNLKCMVTLVVNTEMYKNISQRYSIYTTNFKKKNITIKRIIQRKLSTINS